MRWKLVEATDDDETALTADELIALSIHAAQGGMWKSGEPYGSTARAWTKIQAEVERAFGPDDEDA